jgi:hypothetical protein
MGPKAYPQEQTVWVQVAEAILVDFRGGYGYYKDPKVLSSFLGGKFVSTENERDSVAQSIVNDYNGAGYYKDPMILADFLKGRFGESNVR